MKATFYDRTIINETIRLSVETGSFV